MNLRLLPKHLIGQMIRGIRGRLRLSQASLAEQLGLEGGEETVRRWESGEEQPDRNVLTRLATMGLVDVLVFHQQEDTEHLPPGEAAELQGILLRMEALLVEAREVVERAARRSQPALSASVEVSAEVRPRKTAKKAPARKSTRAKKNTGE
ncbi:MAG TPA: helix-turn-helix transcriptional regulator [Longimicrobium sp.]|jgi:transcriptional regulator with XRE-family HTH domain